MLNPLAHQGHGQVGIVTYIVDGLSRVFMIIQPVGAIAINVARP